MYLSIGCNLLVFAGHKQKSNKKFSIDKRQNLNKMIDKEGVDRTLKVKRTSK